MKVLFISGREPTYTRNSVILKGLNLNAVDVTQCTSSSKNYLNRYTNVLINFLMKNKNFFDVIFVGFFGQPLVPLVKKLTNKPIIFDVFLSAYDTMCFERKKFSPNSLFGKLFYLLDKISLEKSDYLLLDTNTHINYFTNTFAIPQGKFQRIFVGADNTLFYPRENISSPEKFTVFYYGTYLPLHGIEFIVKAAEILQPYQDIEFIIVGKGIERKKIDKMVKQRANELSKVRFIDWIPYEQLPLEIARSDVCLGGHFSNIEKAKRVIAGKTFQFIAMKKPVIIGNNVANKELFQHGKNAFLVNMADAGALADAILLLKQDASLRSELAEQGYQLFQKNCTPEIIGKQIIKIINEKIF
jgi:glycosyltransferase involved in cell wall biosynthesis